LTKIKPSFYQNISGVKLAYTNFKNFKVYNLLANKAGNLGKSNNFLLKSFGFFLIVNIVSRKAEMLSDLKHETLLDHTPAPGSKNNRFRKVDF